jgi:hypothetical protein
MSFPRSRSIPTLTEVARLCFKPCHMKVLYLGKKNGRIRERCNREKVKEKRWRMTIIKKWLPAEFYGVSPLVLMHSANSINHSRVFCSYHGGLLSFTYLPRARCSHMRKVIESSNTLCVIHNKWSLKLPSSNIRVLVILLLRECGHEKHMLDNLWLWGREMQFYVLFWFPQSRIKRLISLRHPFIHDVGACTSTYQMYSCLVHVPSSLHFPPLRFGEH